MEDKLEVSREGEKFNNVVFKPGLKADAPTSCEPSVVSILRLNTLKIFRENSRNKQLIALNFFFFS